MDKLFQLIITFIIAGMSSGAPTTAPLPVMPTIYYPTPTQPVTYVLPTTVPPTEVYQEAAVVVVEDAPIVYVVPTISYMASPTAEMAMPTESQVVQPTQEWEQWITPYPGTLPPAPPSINIDDIDQVWDALATPQSIPVTSPCPVPLPPPFVTWSMATEAAMLDGSDSESVELPASTISRIMAQGGGYFPTYGTVTMPEDGMMDILLSYAVSGTVTICQDTNGKPTVYGPGVQSFLDMLSVNYLR